MNFGLGFEDASVDYQWKQKREQVTCFVTDFERIILSIWLEMFPGKINRKFDELHAHGEPTHNNEITTSVISKPMDKSVSYKLILKNFVLNKLLLQTSIRVSSKQLSSKGDKMSFFLNLNL